MTKPSTIMMSFLIFVLVMVSAGMFNLAYMDALGIDANDSSTAGEEHLNTTVYSKYWEDTNSTVYTMSTDLQDVNSSGGLGQLELGWDFLQNSWSILRKMFTLFGTSKEITQDIGEQFHIPPIVYFSLISIITLIILFSIISSMRRYEH